MSNRNVEKLLIEAASGEVATPLTPSDLVVITNGTLFWSNADGWIDLGSATVFGADASGLESVSAMDPSARAVDLVEAGVLWATSPERGVSLAHDVEQDENDVRRDTEVAVEILNGLIAGLGTELVDSARACAGQQGIFDPQFSPLSGYKGLRGCFEGICIDLDRYDEDALPFFRFGTAVLAADSSATQQSIDVGEEDIADGADADLEALMARVCQVFGEARELGYSGPYHLAEDGIASEKAAYAEALSQRFETRSDYADYSASRSVPMPG